MPAWVKLTEDDLLSSMTQRERDDFAKVASGASVPDRVIPILSDLTAEIRGYIATWSPNTISADITLIPPSFKAKALAIAEKALSSKDDFVGFIDADETTLQFLVDGTDSVWVDLPAPELKGSYGVHTNRARVLQIISRLSPPLSRYRAELKLEFAKWD